MKNYLAQMAKYTFLCNRHLRSCAKKKSQVQGNACLFWRLRLLIPVLGIRNSMELSMRVA